MMATRGYRGQGFPMFHMLSFSFSLYPCSIPRQPPSSSLSGSMARSQVLRHNSDRGMGNAKTIRKPSVFP